MAFFSKGNLVKCVRPTPTTTKGKIYKVEECHSSSIEIIDDYGDRSFLHPYRFDPVPKYKQRLDDVAHEGTLMERIFMNLRKNTNKRVDTNFLSDNSGRYITIDKIDVDSLINTHIEIGFSDDHEEIIDIGVWTEKIQINTGQQTKIL
jgi:hypothetical protein